MIDNISILLKSDQVNDQIVKSIVHVLKLTGRYIEEDLDPACLNSLFDDMEKLQSCPKISSAAKNNIRQVRLLREREWGISKEDFMNGSMNSSYHQNGQQDEGVMYGPDGKPLTKEEQMFLEENCGALDSTFSSNMIEDDGALADYEDFLREQAEANAISVAEKALQSLSVDEDDLTSPQRGELKK